MPKQRVIQGDCVQIMKGMLSESVDVVVTSPPYNIGLPYHQYQDDLPTDSYLGWLLTVFEQVKRVLKHNGSLFLNVGFTCKQPWIADDVARTLRGLFVLQNRIAWIKSIAIDNETTGHFKPINSPRFLNQTHESIFHFTKSGTVAIDRLAIGVPFKHKSNVGRFGHAQDLRCRGNVWYIPYDTIQDRATRGHPCVFPIALPEMCIRLHGITADTVVLEPFLGSGTTLVACQKVGVRGIGIDIDPLYCKYARRRLT